MIVIKRRREAVDVVHRAVLRHSRGNVAIGREVDNVASGKTHIEWRGSVIAIWGGQRAPSDYIGPDVLGADYFGVNFGESRRERKYSPSEGGVAERDILTWLFGSEIEEGDEVSKLINQGIREGEVVKITPTRARLRYSMPKRGVIEGWYPVSRMWGRTLLTITNFDEVTGHDRYCSSNFPVTEYDWPEVVRLFSEGDTPAASVLDVWLGKRVTITPHGDSNNQGERIQFNWSGSHKWGRTCMDSPQAKNLLAKLSKKERGCVLDHLRGLSTQK